MHAAGLCNGYKSFANMITYASANKDSANNSGFLNFLEVKHLTQPS